MVFSVGEFKLAAGWIKDIGKAIFKSNEEKKKQIQSIADELLFSPYDLAPFFVEPELQPHNPVDASEEDDILLRHPAFRFLELFIKAPKEKLDGRRQLFILADAGMGKTALLAMFKLAHLSNFWPSDYECIALKLGDNTLERLEKIDGRGNKVLLLDSLDEDPKSFGRIEERITELLKETVNFFRVIITCRNQFLPLGDDKVFPNHHQIKIGGFKCPIRYISPFSEELVREYLVRKYCSGKDPEEEKETVLKAKKIIENSHDLQFRPMLLAYMDDLVKENVDKSNNPYEIYKTLVEAWLDREERKKNSKVKADNLREAVILLAMHMTKNNLRKVTLDQIGEIFEHDDSICKIGLVGLGGKSLLNKSKDGELHFAHKTFQEFLSVYALDYGKNGSWLYISHEIEKFLFNSPSPYFNEVNFVFFKNRHFFKDFRENFEIIEKKILSNFSIKSLRKFSSYYMTILDEKSEFNPTSFCRIQNFSDKQLNKSTFRYTANCRLKFNRSSMKLTVFSESYFLDAKFNFANLQNAIIRNACFVRCDFAFADLKGLREWRSCISFKVCNIYKIKNAPEGFREWALNNGAVEMEPEEYKEFLASLKGE